MLGDQEMMRPLKGLFRACLQCSKANYKFKGLLQRIVAQG